MRPETLRRILWVVAAVAAGYGATVLLGGPDDGGGPGGPVPTALGRAADAGLDSVRIESRGDTVVLRRGEDGWRMDGYRADTADVSELRASLGEGMSLEVAARNPENHARLGVDSAGARRLVLGLSGGDPVTLLVGNEGPYRSSVYLRAPGTDRVYLARGGLGPLVRQARDEWRDRTIIAADTSRVQAVRVRRGDTTYRLRRSGGRWRLGDGPADSLRSIRFLGDLAGLEATRFAADTASVEPADRTLTVLGRADGDTLARVEMRRAGPEDSPHYLVAVRGRKGIFEVEPSRADRLTPEPAELRPGQGEGASGSGSGGSDGARPPGGG